MLRHGQTDWNVEGRYQGRKGLGLNENGFEQANRAAGELKSLTVSKVFSSDQLRAVQTGEIVSRACGVELITDQRLQEINLGVWEGRLASELELEYPDLFEQRERQPETFRPPHGETLLDVRVRVRSFLCTLPSHSDGTIVIVSHSVTLGVLRAELQEVPLANVYRAHLPNCQPHRCKLRLQHAL